MNPNATEICDGGVDNNCDGLVDDATAIDALDWFYDADADGFGTSLFFVILDGRNSQLTQCEQPNGFVLDNTDCDDLRNLVHPDAIENCNTFYDDDCDGESNWDSLPNEALGCTDYYSDVDLDGYGDPNDMRCACDPEGFFTATNDDDCDDFRDDTHLGATEL